ncbi:MAG: FKBP-type peptidyl-prolyl cis-trans isomerase [Pseudomonadota bacterium]
MHFRFNQIMLVTAFTTGSFFCIPTNVAHSKSESNTECKNTKMDDIITTQADQDYSTTATGLQYKDTKVGDGASPKRGQTVIVHYTGRLTNGKIFDSSHNRNKPFKFQIGIEQVIKGWDEGVATMKVGGKRTLIIPAALGYGALGAGDDIPPHATLEFDVELLGIE